MNNKGKNFVLMDYAIIIFAFISFIVSLVIYYTFSFKVESNLYLFMMILNAIFLIAGLKNLVSDIYRA